VTPTVSATPTLSDLPGPGQSYLYPAPATGDKAAIAYYMSKQGRVFITVWSAAAERVAEFNETKQAGPQISNLNIRSYAMGVYLYRVRMEYDRGGSEKLKVKRFVVRR
jgi:hypothetical protein